MQGLMRGVCVAYLISLTVLLLTSNPARLVGLDYDLPLLVRWLMPAAHFLSFLVLAFLSLVVRWPLPRWGIALLLVVYAGATEMAQSFTVSRAAEWVDWLQDIAGVAVGALSCWILTRIGCAILVRKNRASDFEPTRTSEEWNVVRTVMSRPLITRSQSWWE